MTNQPLSESKKSSPNMTGCLVLFFGIFLLVGTLTFFKFFLEPITSIIKAQFWTTVTCKIVSSDLATNKNSDGDTYRVNIAYNYNFNGQQYLGTRYNFATNINSSNYRETKSIVASYPIGKETLCYVNPSYPEDSVLIRGLYGELIFGFIPIIFLVVGGGGVYAALFQKGFITSGQRNKETSYVADNFSMQEKVLLTPTVTPLAKCVGYFMLALIWNGITSIFTFQVIQDWLKNRPDMIMTLFNLPFSLIGLGLIVGFFYQVSALFSPRPKLYIDARAVPLGGTLKLSWQTTGRVKNISKMRIQLIGREEATYRRGTDSVTDKEIFYEYDVFGSVTTSDIANGSAKIEIPADAMHSFAGEHNKVIWLLTLKVDIAHYPNIDDEYEIQVLPIKRVFNK